MGLALYRRHPLEFKSGHPEDLRTSEYDERKKGWQRCECPIFVSGSLQKKFRRQSTGCWEWEPARAVVTRIQVAGHWDPDAVEPPQPMALTPVGQVTIERAVAAFLKSHNESSALSTFRMNLYFLNRFKDYSAGRGYVVLEQWATVDVRESRSSWGVAASTANRNMTMLKSFFEFAVTNEWIEKNPARIRDKRTRKQTSKKERIPFSDEELKRMFDVCENQYGKIDGEESWRFRWTGQDLADFISLSVYSGLRISDVATFHSDRLQDNGECHIRTTKTGKKVYTWLPSWLQTRIRERAEKHGPLVFGKYDTEDMSVVTDLWRRKLNRLWDLCGQWDERPTHHRFRHTFARILLQKANVTVRDVAELLGNTEAVLLKHYSAWIPERQARLTTVLREAFEDKPKPRLIEMSKRHGTQG
jgi:integrase